MNTLKALALGAVAAGLIATPVAAQTQRQAVVNDLRGVHEKIVGLAQTVPVDKYTWRPGQGVRSIGDVYMHIASANFRFPGMVGMQPPAGTSPDWISGNAEGVTRETAVAALNASFEFLYSMIEDIDDLDAPVNLFGQDTNVRQFLVTTGTHLHEHLGQSIAYARTNGIVPPWSGM
jgi:uncharacterized damage-inducible protein DinB